MPCVRFRDESWVGKCIHLGREKILNARMMLYGERTLYKRTGSCFSRRSKTTFAVTCF